MPTHKAHRIPFHQIYLSVYCVPGTRQLCYCLRPRAFILTWGGGKGKSGWALARGTAPRRASLGAYTGPPGLTLCSHGPHRRLMTCNTGPADGAAGPRGGPHPFRQHAPPGPRIPAPGPTRPQPGRASLTPVPQLLVYERQGSSAHQLSPQTTTCAWVHPCRSRLPTSHAASAAASSPRLFRLCYKSI